MTPNEAYWAAVSASDDAVAAYFAEQAAGAPETRLAISRQAVKAACERIPLRPYASF